jgi:hypothetical protein
LRSIRATLADESDEARRLEFMLDGIATFLEKLPGFALKSGFILALMGLALHGAIWLGVVEEAALGGNVAQSAPVLWVVGGAMMAGGMLFVVFGWLASLRSVPRNWRARREARKKLIGNIAFLNDDACLMLLMILRLPDGRIPPMGDYPPLKTLYDFGLLVPEEPLYVLTSGLPRVVMKVAPPIYDKREELIRQLSDHLTKTLGVDVRQEQVLARESNERMERWQKRGVL